MGSQTDSSGASGIEPNLGLLGRKIGMMRIFSDDGESIPVTVIDVSNNRISQVKTAAVDGYAAVQMVHGERRATPSPRRRPVTSPRPASRPAPRWASSMSRRRRPKTSRRVP
jgi:ribosomal protein L3